MIKGKENYYSADRTTVLRFFALSLAFALTILLGFGAQFFIQTDFDSTAFWGDLGFSWSLCVYCLFLGMPEAKDYYRRKPGCRYQEVNVEFREIRQQVSPNDEKFDEWLEYYYKEQRLDYFRQVLTVYGITNYRVLDLDYTELDNLKQPYTKTWGDGSVTEFKSLTEKQIFIVGAILSGKLKIRKIPNDSFKTTNGKITSNEYVTQSREEARAFGTYLFLIVARMALMFFISLILVLFGIKMAETTSTEQVINQVINTLSKLWTMASSYMYGYSIGKLMVSNECNRIEYKTRVNKAFRDWSLKNPDPQL